MKTFKSDILHQTSGYLTCNMLIGTNRLPYFVSQASAKIMSVSFFADTNIAMPQLHLKSPGNVTNNNFSFAADPLFGTLQKSNPGAQSWGNTTLGLWKIIKPGNAPLTSSDVKDMYVLIHYSVG